jgi:Asp-tRNA(Asn)/Glu-tRNA(Gln) amidotransferase A subunit family amidase
MRSSPRARLLPLTIAIAAVFAGPADAQIRTSRAAGIKASPAMDRDLLEVTIPRLHRLYASHKYTVTQVVRWYIARIAKYNGIYQAIEQVDEAGALQTAAREDADARAAGNRFRRPPLWGVPIVIKSNTSIEGLVTSDGWKGYTLPGHELVAPADATIVRRLKAAGAVIIGHTNMPDFAASDTNRSSAFGRTGNAYDVRFSPGGSSGGTVTAVTANLAALGTGTDTGNSIRMPSATSAVVGVFPTRGLVSIAGIAPLDWLLDNTGPIARTVTDAAIALGVMAGPDPLDPRTADALGKAESGPYTGYLKSDALKGKRLGVPAFVLRGTGVPFQGGASSNSDEAAARRRREAETPLQPETRDAFMKAIEGLRAAGATVVFDDAILPDSFAETIGRVYTRPYIREGTDAFLRRFGPAAYHSADEYEKAIGKPLPPVVTGASGPGVDDEPQTAVVQRALATDPEAEANYYAPRRRALDAYSEVFDRMHLDGLVYPAAQMPPPDETMPQNGRLSSGPHSATSWVNMIGVPAVVVPAGFYATGLPFGLEIAARPWHDGELLGYAYAYERATKHRRPPVLVNRGLLPMTPAKPAETNRPR